MKRRIEIGLLYSRSGSYPLLSEACRAGALSALEAINADPGRSFVFLPVERDPQGRIELYAPLCQDIVTRSAARHIVGCITSWSRKEIIPTLERHGALLWYAAPYEGFEANDHVIYMNASPNQHLVPLVAYVAARFGRDAFLVGSNYIWGWEMNRVARDLVSDTGGEVKGERYLPLGNTDVSRLIEEIRATAPNFVLNNLIGSSSYAFYAAFAALGREDARFRPERCPVLSCNLTEQELPAIAPHGEGHLSCGPFFADEAGAGSSFAAAAHAAMTMLADAIETTGSDDPAAVRQAVAGRSFDTALGAISIDPQTQHASLPVRIGRIRGAAFEIVQAGDGVVEPDPYLSRYDPFSTFRSPLRLVR